MRYNWGWLIFAVIVLAAVSTLWNGTGKWIFALVMLGVLLVAGDKILPKGVF